MPDLLGRLDPVLGQCVDAVCHVGAATVSADAAWLREGILGAVSTRWNRERGGTLEWHPALVEWLLAEAGRRGLDRGGVERFLEGEVLGALARQVQAAPPGSRLVVVREGNGFKVHPVAPGTADTVTGQ